MASTIQVDKITDVGGNTIISSNGSGTFTSNLPASAPNVSTATGTLPIANGGTGAATLAAAGLANTPVWDAYLANDSDQSISDSTSTKIQFDAERIDTAGAFDTTNYKYVVPSGQGGTYLIILQAKFSSSQQNDVVGSSITLKINGSDSNSTSFTGAGYISGTKYPILGNQLNLSCVKTLAASDYLEGFAFVKTNGAGTPKVQEGDDLATFFQGFKLIG